MPEQKIKKIIDHEMGFYLNQGYVPYISFESISHFSTEDRLVESLKKDKCQAVYWKLSTGFWTALIKL